MSNYLVQTGTLFEDFESFGDWTITGTGASGTANTSIFKTGTQSLKLTSGSGTNCVATKTINADMSRAGRIGFWLYLPSIVEVSSIQFVLSSNTSFTSFFSYTPAIAVLHEGWNYVLVGRDLWSNTGSESWSNTMVRLRVRVNANTSQVAVAYFDSIYTGEYSRPKCILTFDDNKESQYSVAYAYMQSRGLRGTCYIMPNRVGAAGYMSLAQMQEMYNAGWDMSVHDFDNWVNTYLTQPEFSTQLVSLISYLKTNGFTRNNCHLHAAYPQGAYNNFILAEMANQGMLTGRSTKNRTQANYTDNRYILTRQVPVNTTALAQAKAFVDRAIADGGAVFLNFHLLVTTPSVDTEWATTDFQALVDYLLSKKEQIDVVTTTEWYRGLTNARKLI
jgi:peptidoglycan/xylan/chitin deacetylase (PgdA/CDA1 family)